MIHVMGTSGWRHSSGICPPAVGSSDIVGIDGPSGSGKAVWPRRLVNRTDATLVEIDDFVSWADFSGWWPRFTDSCATFAPGEDAHYQVRDCTTTHTVRPLGGWENRTMVSTCHFSMV